MRTSPSSVIAVMLLGLLLAAGCRLPDPRRVAPEAHLTTFEEAARGSADIAGAYELTRINKDYLPAAITMIDDCRTSVDSGRMLLTEDGRYRLEMRLTLACSDETLEEQITLDGLFALVGSRLRFGERMVPARQELAPQTTIGREDVVAALFPEGRLAAVGSFRAGRVTVTLPDLRTLYFKNLADGPVRPPEIDRAAPAAGL